MDPASGGQNSQADVKMLRIDDLEGPGAGAGLEYLRQVGGRFENWCRSDMARGDDSHRPPGIHASEISSCMRQAAYTMLSTEKKGAFAVRDPLFWWRKFEAGKALHAQIQGQMHRWGRAEKYLVDFQDEVPITPYTSQTAAQYNIHSSCDGIFTFREVQSDGTLADVARLGLEIKSASYLEFPKITQPKPEHVRQAHLYMACLDLPACWLMYYNKGNENITETRGRFLVVFDWAAWGELEFRIHSVHESVNSGGLPEKEEGSHCQFCKYAWVCRPASAPQMHEPRRRT